MRGTKLPRVGLRTRIINSLSHCLHSRGEQYGIALRGLTLSTALVLSVLGGLLMTSFASFNGRDFMLVPAVHAADSRFGTTLGGIRWDRIYNPCIEAIKSVETLYRPRGPIPEPGPLVIGCSLPDCGPGTDGPGPIDLRITLSGDPAEKVVIEFENMTARDAGRISVKGNARHVKGTSRFEMGRGTSALRGFTIERGRRPPVGYPRLVLARSFLERISRAAGADDLLAESKYPVAFIAEQFRGKASVGGYAILYILGHCLPPPAKSDRVEFPNGVPPDTVLVLAPGRIAKGSTGCADYEDQVYESSGASFIRVQNHLEDGDSVISGPFSRPCRSEIVVYSKSTALAVVQPVTPPWSSGSDKVPAELLEPLKVPVTLWILNDDPPNHAANDLKNEIANANIYYRDSMCGITFDDNPTVHSVTTDIALPPGDEENYLSFDPSDGPKIMQEGCTDPGLGKPCLHAPDTLNVYLVKYILGDVGFTSFSPAYGTDPNCTTRGQLPRCDNFGDMVFLVPSRRDDTLAHELGHTMELEGITGVGNLGNQNLMWEYDRRGMAVTKGQCYRTNVDEFSYVNSSGVRPASSPRHRHCPIDDGPSDRCPDLSFDR